LSYGKGDGFGEPAGKEISILNGGSMSKKQIKRRRAIPGEASTNPINHDSKSIIKEAQRFAHDIKAPLMVIRGSLLNTTGTLPTQALIQHSVERLFEMSREYLEFLHNTPSSTPRALSTMTSLQVKRLVKEKLSCIPALAYERGMLCSPKLYNYIGLQRLIRPSHETADDFIRADSSSLSRIIDNIILNSLEAMSPSCRPAEIICRIYCEDSQLILEFQDNGSGISSEHLSRILKADYRSTKPDGHGLGLSTSKRILDTWGARIEITSKAGRGSIVTLQLPLHDKPAVHELN
jgi:signal transduction histidine kinase